MASTLFLVDRGVAGTAVQKKTCRAAAAYAAFAATATTAHLYTVCNMTHIMAHTLHVV